MIQERGRFVNAAEQKRRAPLRLLTGARISRFRHVLASAFVVTVGRIMLRRDAVLKYY